MGAIPEESPREGYYPSREQFRNGTRCHPSSGTRSSRADPINNELPQSFVKLTAGQTNARWGNVVRLNG